MMRAVYAVLAATLMTLILTGHQSPFYVFIIAMLMGLYMRFWRPGRVLEASVLGSRLLSQ